MNNHIENLKAADENVYITKKLLAERLMVSTRTVEIWMRQRKLPFVKIGKTVRFHWQDVRRCLAQRTKMPAQEPVITPQPESGRSPLNALATSIRKARRGKARGCSGAISP